MLWPKRATFEHLLAILNATELANVWGEDETIGWVYQFFNGQDERKKMRDESQAPRNSRELAVRNQFFTPRYVVQFLTDNTLGRIWYEMRGTNTVLAERCAYMVRKPGEEFAPRAKKDPRDLRVLDPACGSGHFLLYAFDLLLAIYEEACCRLRQPRRARRQARLWRTTTRASTRFERPSRRSFSLTTYTAWTSTRAAHRSPSSPCGCARRRRIGTSASHARSATQDPALKHRGGAEPLVADDKIAKEFVAKAWRRRTRARVASSLVESLSLAGDMGLLLRVEQLVARQAKRGQTGDLFAPPEERIRAALCAICCGSRQSIEYEQAPVRRGCHAGRGTAGDRRTTVDVVLMNPPFGACSLRAKNAFEKAYPRSKNDVYAAFVERGIELLLSHARLGAITSRSGIRFLSSFQRWREEVLLNNAPPTVFADLGYGVLDGAMVETAAYCLEVGA